MPTLDVPACRYAMEVTWEDGTPVGQVPVEVDWEPAGEAARLEALGRGADPDTAFTSRYQVTPRWDAGRGPPYLAGFRVTLEGNEATPMDFPRRWFQESSRTVVAKMVADGLLAAGDRVRGHPLAFPLPALDDGALPRPTLGRPAAPAIPLLPLPLSRFGTRPEAGERGAADPPVFIPAGVIRELGRLTLTAGPQETGGILIGHLCRDPADATVFLAITAQVPARHTEASATRLSFTPETWTEVRAAIRLRGRDEIMLGWWHSHPVREWCRECSEERRETCTLRKGFLSEHDRRLHRTVFPRAYSVALVASDVADSDLRYALFGWRQGTIQSREFITIEEDAHVQVA